MTNLATDNVAGGDADSALKTLLTDNGQPVRRAAKQTTSDIEARFSGKTPEQLVEMYRNLESHSGRLASQLGQTQQQLSEALAVAKRNADLRDNSANSQPTERQINGMELIADPNKALNDLLDSRVKKLREETDARVNRLEAELARTRFERNHPDAQQLLNDPLVAEFSRGTPLRSLLAQRASQGDAGAADALLTEFKQYKDKIAAPNADKANNDAANVSLESSRSGEANVAAGGKIYKRADIMALRMRNPDEYYSEAVQGALMRAYAERRVVD